MTDNDETRITGEEAESEASTFANRHKRKNASQIWDHFTKVDESQSKCNHCGKVFACNSKRNGTSSARNHMYSCSQNPHFQREKGQRTLALLKKSGEEDNELKVVSWSKEGFRRALAIYILLDELPFRHVEGEGFRQYSSYLNPKFQAPSRVTVARDIYKLFLEEKVKLKEELRQQRIAITTDTWTSIQNINYMCVTAHWISKEWVLKKRIISFSQISSHKGESIANELLACFNDWGLSKILSITVDNASSNDTAIEKLKKKVKDRPKFLLLNGEWLHIRCACHILNLVVTDGLKELAPSIASIRAAVRYVRSSPTRLAKFKEVAENEQIISSALLSLDVPTRWNSTYLMLEAAVKYQKAFNALEDDLHYQNYFEESIDGAPTESDWENAKAFEGFLRSFYELTLQFSGSLYLTSNRYLIDIVQAKEYLSKLSKSDDRVVCGMAQNMKAKYDKYWGRPEKMNRLLFVAVILDPR